MAYYNDYSFCRKFNANGSMTRWYAVVSLLRDKGPMSKSDILDEIWPYRGLCADRGYMSSLFAQLNESGMVHYSKADRKWHFDAEPTQTKRRINPSRYGAVKNSNTRSLLDGRVTVFSCGMYDEDGHYIDLWC